MKPERWRLFVAVPIGDELRRDLAAAVEEWKRRPDLAGLRWTDPENWHVTLAFLGWVEARAVRTVTLKSDEVAARHQPMTLKTGGLGGFPSDGRTRIAWYGVVDSSGSLARLSDDIHYAMGRERAAPFHPHVTLARARSEPVDARTWVSEGSTAIGNIDVKAVELMRSRVGGQPRYEIVSSATLGGLDRGT